MTTAPTIENPIYLSKVEIPHLGTARKEYLKEWFHVDTVQGLAALSADDVEARFKAERKTVSRSKIEGWIGEAQKLAAAANSSSQRAVDVKATGAETKEKSNSPAGEGEWKSFASFLVVFQARQMQDRTEEQQITILHKETDKPTIVPGIKCEPLCQWMLGQLGERVQLEPEPKEIIPAKAMPVAARPEAMEVTQIRAFQPPHAKTPVGVGKAEQLFPGFVKGHEPFVLEASFELDEQAAAEIAKEAGTYRLQFYTYDLATGATKHLGDTKPNTLVEGRPLYTATLPAISLPPGLYRLRVFATLRGAFPLAGYLEVPLFQVV